MSIDGSCYFGDWLANRKEGYGREMYEDGSFYEG